MLIRVMIHLDCGHIEATSILPYEINDLLTKTRHLCAKCSFWGSTEVLQPTRVFSLIPEAA